MEGGGGGGGGGNGLNQGRNSMEGGWTEDRSHEWKNGIGTEWNGGQTTTSDY